MTIDFKDMDSNQIINNLNELLAQGYNINNVVLALNDVHVIANYSLLIQKGASNIDLIELSETVNPVVVLNNLETFTNAKIAIDIPSIIAKLDDEDALTELTIATEQLLRLGINPQIIADKCISSNGSLLNFIAFSLSKLIDAGAQISADELIDKLLEDNNLLEDFNDDKDIALLIRAGASPEALHKLKKYLFENTFRETDYAGPYPRKLDLIESGQQLQKIFFLPSIQIRKGTAGNEIQSDWSGRVLPGQTLKEGIAMELKEVYGYSGKFKYDDIHFLDYIKDYKDKSIQRYGIYITLYPSDTDKLTLDIG